MNALPFPAPAPIALARGLAFAACAASVFAEATEPETAIVDLPELYVSASHTATVEPAATYGTPVSRLELNPQIDLQARNLAEAQGDVTIRGGIFENTGFRIGAATVMDPQTGHYFSEIPIAPEMLRGPGVLVGADNALYGFNSSVGTIDYRWSEIADGGSLSAGLGDHGLNYQRLHHAQSFRAGADVPAIWGGELEYSRSESNGTIANGDHNFSRVSGRLQRRSEESQTDLFAGYQTKFLAWPELYAAPYNSPESDRVRTTLLMANHLRSYGDDSSVEATAYYRQHNDHYLFNRFATSDRAFVHETKVYAAAVAGSHRFSERFALAYSGQATADEIESTKLENSFTSRSYVKLAALPEFLLLDAGETSLALRAGAAFDDTNRDDSALSPLADLTWTRRREAGDDTLYLSLTQATQVAGYTAIGGATSGLFASNPDLERETSRNLELGGAIRRNEWSLQAAVFHRWDDDLVDWTYSFSRSSARAARNVDVRSFGFEAIGSRRFGQLELLGSYTYLDKSDDYGAANVDASFYALNFAEHRITAAAIWTPHEIVQLRIDNEYRQQAANVLREGSDSAFLTNLGISFYLPGIEQLELRAAAENLWQDDFQDIPGTPGRGRQLSAGATWSW